MAVGAAQSRGEEGVDAERVVEVHAATMVGINLVGADRT